MSTQTLVEIFEYTLNRLNDPDEFISLFSDVNEFICDLNYAYDILNASDTLDNFVNRIGYAKFMAITLSIRKLELLKDGYELNITIAGIQKSLRSRFGVILVDNATSAAAVTSMSLSTSWPEDSGYRLMPNDYLASYMLGAAV